MGTSVPQPGMMAAVNLHQHAFLGHSLPSHPVSGRPTFPRAGNARPGQDAVHRSPAEVNPLPVTQQLGEVGLIGSGIGDGVAGPTAAVPVGQCVGALLAIGRQQAPGQDAFSAPYPHWGGKWATRPRNPPVLPTVGPGRRCQRLGLPQPQAAPSRNWATWGPRRQDGLGVASHQERCPMRRRVSGTGPEVCSCGASARFPAGCCPSVVLSCVSVQTITVGRALRELRPRRPPQPLPASPAQALPQPPGSLIIPTVVVVLGATRWLPCLPRARRAARHMQLRRANRGPTT